MKLKHTLLALVLASSAASTNASEIEFLGSNFGGLDVTFDMIDFLVEEATVTQTDSNNSTNIIGPDWFDEFGSTSVVALVLDNSAQPYLGTNFDGTAAASDLVMYFDYNVQGFASQGTGITTVDFTALPNAELYVMWDQDGDNNTGSNGRETKVSLANFTLNSGNCLVDSDIVNGEVVVNAAGANDCNLEMEGTFAAGNFFFEGADLSTIMSPISVSYEATVQNFDGLNFSYDGEDQQTFKVTHDANMSIHIPEPSSIAILGLGLLGLARIRRKA